MSGVEFFRNLYRSNKKWFVISILIVAVLVVVGCTAGQGGAPPPSGPIGGGCG